RRAERGDNVWAARTAGLARAGELGSAGAVARGAAMRWLITLSLWLIAAPLHAQTLEALVDASPRCPGVRQVQREALRHHQLDGPVDPWTGRARWSNAIPQLDAEVRWLDQHDDRADYREDLVTGTPGVGLLAPDDIRQQFVSGTRTQRVWRLRARV